MDLYVWGHERNHPLPFGRSSLFLWEGQTIRGVFRFVLLLLGTVSGRRWGVQLR